MVQRHNETTVLALAHLRRSCEQSRDRISASITINFHPDLTVAGTTTIALIARDGFYRSQFETGVSSGGITAHRGGERWNWESRIFGGVYDAEDNAIRPKYGALNHQDSPVGGARRFGSAHFRLAPHVRSRTSFCYPDSYWQPHDFAVSNVERLVALADANDLKLDCLDNYIEAHVHGTLQIEEDVEAIVLDPSFQGTEIEKAALSLRCRVEWHGGFKLHMEQLATCESYRGPVTARAIERIAEGDTVSPATIMKARSILDYQTAKWVWHCVARFGHP